MKNMFKYNPWYGCKKFSKGCQNCYLFTNRTNYPFRVNEKIIDILTKKDEKNEYIIQGNQEIDVCLHSDFFLEEANRIRKKVLNMMKERKDLTFNIWTRRTENIKFLLPMDFKKNYQHLNLIISIEDNESLKKRVTPVLELNLTNVTLIFSPLLEEVMIKEIIKDNKNIKQIYCRGDYTENPIALNIDHVKRLYDDTKDLKIPFAFIDTGNKIIMEGKEYLIPRIKGRLQAVKSGLSHN